MAHIPLSSLGTYSPHRTIPKQHIFKKQEVNYILVMVLISVAYLRTVSDLVNGTRRCIRLLFEAIVIESVPGCYYLHHLRILSNKVFIRIVAPNWGTLTEQFFLLPEDFAHTLVRIASLALPERECRLFPMDQTYLRTFLELRELFVSARP